MSVRPLKKYLNGWKKLQNLLLVLVMDQQVDDLPQETHENRSVNKTTPYACSFHIYLLYYTGILSVGPFTEQMLKTLAVICFSQFHPLLKETRV